MRKRIKYGVFVCVLSITIVLVLLYYGMSNDTGQLDSHTILPDLNSTLSSPDNVLEAVQSEEVQVSVEEEHLEHPEYPQVEQEPQAYSDANAENSPETVLEGRKVTLKDGREIVIVDVPDSLMSKTRIQFDKEGKAHVSCH